MPSSTVLDPPESSAAPFRAATGDEQRTYLAGERTLLAWLRTSLALMGFGFLVAKFGLFLREVVALREAQGPIEPAAPPPSAAWSLWIGVSLVALGVLVNIVAAREHMHFVRQFSGTELARPRRYAMEILILSVISILGIVMAAYLLLVSAH